jgi:hypothetical protein
MSGSSYSFDMPTGAEKSPFKSSAICKDMVIEKVLLGFMGIKIWAMKTIIVSAIMRVKIVKIEREISDDIN